LQEAKVTAVSDEMFQYMLSDQGQLIPVPHGPAELGNWKRKADRIENHYSKRMGVVTGPVEVLFHVDMLKGMRRTDEGAMIKEYDKIPGVETDYAAQTIVWNVVSEDQRFLEKGPAPIEEEFPEGARAFFLGEFNYGRPLEVIKHNDNRIDVWVSTMVCDEALSNTAIGEHSVLTLSSQEKNPILPSSLLHRRKGQHHTLPRTVLPDNSA